MQSRRLSRIVSHVTYFRNFERYIEFPYNNKLQLAENSKTNYITPQTII